MNRRQPHFYSLTILTFVGALLLLPAGAWPRHQVDEALPSADTSHPALVLMSLSAHPDDEDGATLAYYGKLKGVKTYSIFYTRGEGGQNEIGSELGDELGKIRTKETLHAAHILGTTVSFLGFEDFGFSKTARETFAKWGGRDSVLARIVYVLRALKPDVIITNHDTVTIPPRRQHGNHQAVGITGFEAFDSAASPSYHPEQLKDGITPWQVKKLFFRVFRPDSSIGKDSIVAIDVSQKDGTGRTIEQISLEALAQHRSQGMDQRVLSSIPRVFRAHRYLLVRSDRNYPFDERDLFFGIHPEPRVVVELHLPIDTILSPPALEGLPQKSVHARFSRGILIGLVKTYDNTTEEVLKQFNVPYRLLDSSALASGNLDRFTTIILDLRAYFYRHDLVRYNQRVLKYAMNGGNIICFYHKIDDWNGKDFPPYPLTLTSERVTQEEAPVLEMLPFHPFFAQPNEIGGTDWDGWVQERSIYLPSNDTSLTSSKFDRLLAMSDEGEQQPPTSLLWTRCDRGTYTYCSLALYRQLRILHEGAVKLFFNMISQPRR